MKTFVGYVFTDAMIRILQSCGLNFSKEECPSEGHQVFSFFTKNQTCIEIHEILDESLYLKAHKLDHFKPFCKNTANIPAKAFSEFEFVASIERKTSPSSDLELHLNITKEFDLQALVLRGLLQNKEFPKYQYHQTEAFLIHFGPACFDILVINQK
jgi:hypothetical protein